MNENEAPKKGKKKAVILAAAAGLVVLIAAVAAFFLLRNPDYRTMQVYQLDGGAQVEREGVGTVTPYVNMMLESGDRASTMDDGWLYLLLDSNKYLLAEPNTRFAIQASGTRANSRTRLDLEAGALVSHITEPLSDRSSYEVYTPNSVMAVRGTSFRVEVWFDDEGVSHTVLQVVEGIVEVHLLYPDGTVGDEARQFVQGTTVSIWGDAETSDYDGVADEVDYYSMQIPTLEFLKIGLYRGAVGIGGVGGIDLLEEGGGTVVIGGRIDLPENDSADRDSYDITEDELDEIIRLKQTLFTVTFVVDGQPFASQTVLFDHTAAAPLILPTAAGRWDFDFAQPIREDTEIPWIR